MRIKKIPKKTANGDVTTNGGGVAAQNNTTSKPKTSGFTNQPVLTAEQAENLKTWLEDPRRAPFRVKVSALNKKRKRDDDHVENDLWESRLACEYTVQPKDKWDKLRKYRKFTVGSESISTGACIMVKCDEEDEGEAGFDAGAQWKGKVLEVRALDTEHVYVRVAWLNRPEDLEGGRKDYHGRNELIPTNQMDIIDALSINGSIEVYRWDDVGEEDHTVDEDQYFWRQTYDYAGSKTYSKLKLICTDNKPHNPDELILQCPSETCREWMHVKCIGNKAITVADSQAKKKNKKNSVPEQRTTPKNATDGNSDSATVKAKLGRLICEVFLKDVVAGAGAPPPNASEIVITHSNGEQYAVPVRCLLCDTVIEDD